MKIRSNLITLTLCALFVTACDTKPKETPKPPDNVEVRVVALPSEDAKSADAGDDYVAEDEDEEVNNE